MLSGMIFAAFSLFPVLAFSAPSPASHQIILSPEAQKSHGIPKALFNDFNDLAKIVDITNCLETPEGISYPFECNSFCREFPELKLLKQWNTVDNLGDSYGYIAISHEKGNERIVIAFAGAYRLTNAIIDLSATPEDYTPLFSGISSSLKDCPGCKVHGDFYKEWLKTEELIGATVSELVTQYILAKGNPYQLVLVGHKLGGAVATLAAVDFEARGWNPQVTTFGQPKVGNEAFTDYLTGKFTPSTYRRVTHVSDPVPLFPHQGLGFSHYEHEYFISKEFVPYTAADVQICNTDSPCAAHVDTRNSLDLNWETSDYFHHTDTCIREPTSFFSFSTSFFIIELADSGLEKRSNNPQFHPVLETIEELEGEDEGSTTAFEKSQSVWNKKNNTKRNIDLDTKLVKPIPDTKFAKTFAMVEPPPPKTPLEYEDEELYHAMSGFDKAQGMWVKPRKKAPVTGMQKRGIIVDPDASFVKPIPDSKFKKIFAMVEPPLPEPEKEVYVPEYEDEEIYKAMNGFKTAQSMWIKPKVTPEKEKRSIYDPDTRTILSTRAEKQNDPEAIDEEAPAEQSPTIVTGETPLEEFLNIIGEATAVELFPQAIEGGAPSPEATDGETPSDTPGPKNTPKPTAIVKPEAALEPLAPEPSRKPFPVIEVSSFKNIPKPQEPKPPKLEGDSDNLEPRGLDRALRFFHAPKEVLNAQLAANEKAAAYEAHQKAQNPHGKPDAPPSETNPDGDYVKKGGSVLILNGRPLEVDGHPVASSIQKRSNGRGPGLGLRNGPKRGGIKRGGGDKVTKLSSSSPPTTESNSRVGVIENAVPSSFEEEVVNVDKGRNFVLMNNRHMPGNFARKSVSTKPTKPTKRSYVPEEAEKRLRLPEELVFGSAKRSYAPEGLPEHLRITDREKRLTPQQLMNRPRKNPRKPKGRFSATGEYVSSNGENSRRSKNSHNPNLKELPTTKQDSTHEDKFSIPGDVSHDALYLHQPEGHFAVIDQYSRGPEGGFYPAEDRLAVSEEYYHEPEGHSRQPEDYFRRSEDHFAIPEHDFRPSGHFHVPEENFHLEGGYHEQAYIPENFYASERPQFVRDEEFGLPQEMLHFSVEKGFGISEDHFYPPAQHTYVEEREYIPGQWEMWDIQESHTGPLTHTWANARENYEAYDYESYSSELPGGGGEIKYSYNYPV